MGALTGVEKLWQSHVVREGPDRVLAGNAAQAWEF